MSNNNNICSICYITIENKYAQIDCQHIFCPICITTWNEYTNVCPLCKKSFKNIYLNLNGNEVNFTNIETKKLSSLFFSDDNSTICNDYCYVCKKTNNEDLMLICEKCNLKCCHIYCFKIPLKKIPEIDWYCDYCIEFYNIKDFKIKSNQFKKLEDIEFNNLCNEYNSFN